MRIYLAGPMSVFWKKGKPYLDMCWWTEVDVWICLLPCLPIHLSWEAQTYDY